MHPHVPSEQARTEFPRPDAPEAFESLLQDTIVQLAEIDARFQRQRDRVQKSARPEAIREERLRKLEKSCLRQRQPLVLLLASLYQRQKVAVLFPIKPRSA